jgi:hypothetical protein
MTVLPVAFALSLFDPTWMLQNPDAPTDEEAQLEKLYFDGRARFSAADYAMAIDIWTVLLAELPQGDETNAVRLDLLFNIAIAHTRQYDIDDDPQHLKKALTLFRLYAEREPSDELDQRIATLEARLDALNPEPQTEAAPPEPVLVSGPGPAAASDEPRGPSRGLGLGLVIAGGAATVGGVALLVAGSQLRPAAEDSVAELDGLGLDPDDPAFAEGDAFIDDETRRGRVLMASGGAVAGLGLTAVGVGVWALTRSTARRRDVAWWVAPTTRGVTMGGRF